MRRMALLFGAIGLAFGGCGESGSDAGPGEGAATSGSGGAGAAQGGGSAGSSGGRGGAGGSGGTSSASVGGGPAGGSADAGAGSVDTSGGAGGDSEAGAAGAGTEAGAGGFAGDGGAGTTTDGGAPSTGDCEPGTGFVGQLTGPGSPAPNGGVFTTDPNSVDYGDANLDGVVAAYPEFDAVWEVDVDVDGAVVTATAGATPGPGISASRTDFWIADDNVLLKVALDPELGAGCCPNFEVRSGMRISFKATEVSTFIGLGQITAATNFSAGTQGSCVLVTEPDKITDVDFYQMIRISGQLKGEPLGGGDFSNWQLGLSDDILYDFMSADPNLEAGQTITFVGPVSPYVGYHMLVESNPDWVKVED